MIRLPGIVRSRLLWRGVMIATTVVALQVTLYRQRDALIAQEAAFGHAILDGAWSTSELQNETWRTLSQLLGYVAGRASRDDLTLAYEVLWSRIIVFSATDREQFEGLDNLLDDYVEVLTRHDAQVFGSGSLDTADALAMIEDLGTLATRTRRLWAVQFTQNREQFFARISGQVRGTTRDIDALMAIVALASIVYMSFELLMSRLALRREQRLADEARSASEMKSAFLANMSHEIRTPLTGVLGASELLSSTTLDRDQKRLADTIATSAEHLLGVVDQVLDISKIEAGKVEIEDGAVDLHGTLRVVLAMFEPTARDNGLALSVRMAEDVPPHVRGDALRLRQVLANLVSNAVKFTEAGSVTAIVTVGHDAGLGRRLVLTVEDTGIGIHKDAMSRVFDAFAQSDVSDTRKFGGTGLGLTIARKLVRLMDGDLDLQSRPGDGTRATIELPLRPVTLFGPPPTAQAPASPGPAPLTVLIADDNATNRMLLARMLAPLVREVRQTEDGAATVSVWREGGIDLVLLDIQMPVMTGIEAAAEIRRSEHALGLPPVPIYSISANAMPHQIESYAAAGMNGHLSKPYRKADLAMIVARHHPGDRGALAA